MKSFMWLQGDWKFYFISTYVAMIMPYSPVERYVYSFEVRRAPVWDMLIVNGLFLLFLMLSWKQTQSPATRLTLCFMILCGLHAETVESITKYEMPILVPKSRRIIMQLMYLFLIFISILCFSSKKNKETGF